MLIDCFSVADSRLDGNNQTKTSATELNQPWQYNSHRVGRFRSGVMKLEISARGALVGAFTGALARAAAATAFFGSLLANELLAVIPVSLALGGGIGLVAGATGNPLIGGVVGAVLGALSASVTVVPLLILSCLFSLQHGSSANSSPEAFMAAVGAAGCIAGVIGGAAGMSLKRQNATSAENRDEENEEE
jgi:hypothetical protein